MNTSMPGKLPCSLVMKMLRNLFLVGISFFLVFHDAIPCHASTPNKPNVLFILADDLGWGDLSCYGNRQFRTPALDTLASQGTLFTQFYVAGSVCSPSRAAFMTSRWPAELRLHGHLAPKEQNASRGMPDHLDPAVPILPRLLRQAGYITAHIGKWHLGVPPKTNQNLEVYGFSEVQWLDARQEGKVLWDLAERPRATKALVDATIEFLRRNKDKPFYCQTWLVDPHAPLNPSEEQIKSLRKQGPFAKTPFAPPMVVYGATVMEMDRQLKRLLEALQELGLDKNTIIVFSSDNGPEDIQIGNATWSGVGSAGPLRGRKRSLYEGGVRVPFLVRWPAGVPAGRVNNTSVISGVDWFPTICDLTGTTIPAQIKQSLRGESMAAILKGDQKVQRKNPLFWEWRFRIFNHPWNRSPMLAIRDGQWKLLMNPEKSRIELFDIPADPSEQDNVAVQHPEVVQRLSTRLLAWHKSLPAGPVESVAGQRDYPWPKEK